MSDELTEDPCRAEDTVSASRAITFVLLFLFMFSSLAFAILSESLTAMLIASTVGYSSAVAIYGFARNRAGIQSFLFTCPVVVGQYPRLLKRHSVFVALLIAILFVAHTAKPHFAEKASRIDDAFYFAFAIPIGVLALIEVMTNRGVLERAHKDRFGEPPDSDRSANERTISILNRD